MKLYHYAPKENTVMEQGLLSISKGPRDLRAYAHRAGSENREDIIAWLDKTFAGRSRAISCLTEPIKWQGNDAVLKAIVDRSALFSFELEDLLKAGLVESIWCKNGSDAGGYNEKFYEVKPEEIDLSPLAWEKVDTANDLLYAVIRHYLIVLKDGYIPPQFLTEES
ncbi:MAG: hypothetical protein IKN71_07175 [Alphaproteobacteria bacterium]|nr:hypothetical protein [Alphaproteobacteria bacterium]